MPNGPDNDLLVEDARLCWPPHLLIRQRVVRHFVSSRLYGRKRLQKKLYSADIEAELHDYSCSFATDLSDQNKASVYQFTAEWRLACIINWSSTKGISTRMLESHSLRALDRDYGGGPEHTACACCGRFCDLQAAPGTGAARDPSASSVAS